MDCMWAQSYLMHGLKLLLKFSHQLAAAGLQQRRAALHLTAAQHLNLLAWQ